MSFSSLPSLQSPSSMIFSTSFFAPSPSPMLFFFTNSLAFYNGPSSTFFPSNEMDTQPGSFFFFSLSIPFLFFLLYNWFGVFVFGDIFLFFSFLSFLYYFIILYFVYGKRGAFYVMWKRKEESCFIITVSFVSWFAYGFAS